MRAHDTILGHLVGWGLPRRYEEAALEGLAFLLQRYPPLRDTFTALLRAAQPGLPDDLQFATQLSPTAGRPDMAGRSGDQVRVLIETKFGAALADHQPLAPLERLAAEPAATLLLFIAPVWRRPHLRRELLERLKAAGVGQREVDDVLEITGQAHHPRIHILGWTAVLKALGEGCPAEARANLEQLTGLCRLADDDDTRPLVREELTDPQVPARLIQYLGIVRAVIARGPADVFRPVSSKHGSSTAAIGQKIQFSGDKGPVAWIGLDLTQWRKHEAGPLWLHFEWNLGQAKLVRERLQAWASERQRILIDTDDGVVLHLELIVGREQPAVIDDVIAQLRTINALIRKA